MRLLGRERARPASLFSFASKILLRRERKGGAAGARKRGRPGRDRKPLFADRQDIPSSSPGTAARPRQPVGGSSFVRVENNAEARAYLRQTLSVVSAPLPHSSVIWVEVRRVGCARQLCRLSRDFMGPSSKPRRTGMRAGCHREVHLRAHAAPRSRKLRLAQTRVSLRPRDLFFVCATASGLVERGFPLALGPCSPPDVPPYQQSWTQSCCLIHQALPPCTRISAVTFSRWR